MNSRTMNIKMTIVNDALQDLLIDRSKPWYDAFHWAWNRYGIRPLDSLLAAAIALAVLLSFGFGTTIVGVLIGVWYPLRRSLALIAAPRPAETDAVELLSYWQIFTGVLFMDKYIGFLLRAIPFYFLVKTVFLVWCLSSGGSTAVVAKIVKRIKGKRRRLYD